MQNLPSVYVKAVAGRLYPVLTGHPEKWIGWRECQSGDPGCKNPHTPAIHRCECGWEMAEHTIERGSGHRDAPAISVKVKDPKSGRIVTKIHEIRTGRQIRLVRTGGEMVPHSFDIARALCDGDLVLCDPHSAAPIEPILAEQADAVNKQRMQESGLSYVSVDQPHTVPARGHRA